MENYIQNIEFINQYLNKSLSANESEIFLNTLKTDSYFNNLYEEHMVFMEGLKRQTIKAEIKRAKHYYTKMKWVKYIGISTAVVVTSILTYLFLVNNSGVVPKPILETNDSIIISDSITNKKTSKKKIDIQDTLSLIEKEAVVETSMSSKKAPQKETINLESLKKAPQIFTIDSKKDTTIVCNEGTKLNVKANSFVDANNNIVEGNISIAVTEYYKLSDMLLANLTTTSNNKQLETGGMLFIEAKKKDSILKLKENAGIEIQFPKQNKKDNMQLFSGEWKDGIINWSLEKPQVTIASILVNEGVPLIGIEPSGENAMVPFSVVEQPPIFPGCENLEKEQQRKCTSEAINNYIKTNFDESIVQGTKEIGRHNVRGQFNINEQGSIVDIRVTTSNIKLAQEGIRVLEAMPKMKPGKQRGKEVSTHYGFPNMQFYVGKSLKINRTLVTLKSRTTSDMKFEKKLVNQDSILGSVSTDEVSNYVFSTSQLGWVNCDRFTNRDSRIKYKLKIKNDDGTKVNMVFKSLNSILPSRYLEGFDFGYVPKDEDVVIVAIKMNEDKLYLDITETKTEPNPDLKFNFKEVTIQKMKDELKKLNTLFD